MADFIWMPDYGSDVQTEPRVLEAQFGDGYVQGTPDGINNMLGKYPLQFNGIKKEMADAIEDFLRSKKGYLRFSWDVPETTPTKTIQVVCKSWNRTYANWQTYNMRMTFEERV